MVSATQLADFTRCTHRVFLDANGDPAERLAASPELQRLWEEGRAHESRVIAGLDTAEVKGATQRDRVEATLSLMRAGVDLIFHGILTTEDLVGEPDLLKRVDRETTLGAFGYVPVDVKNGRATKSTTSTTTKPAYAIQLCAYAELLEVAQGWRPTEGFIVDHHGAWQPVDLTETEAEYREIRSRFAAVRDGRDETVPGWCAECPQCPWQEHCVRVMKERDDLTLVAGIGIPKREKLITIGIRTVADLASASPDDVASVRGLGRQARLWPLRARSLKSGKPVVLEPWSPPTVEYELSYDVENTPEPYVYLHGLLLRDAQAKHFGTHGFEDADYGVFDPVCATHPQTEEQVWRAFLEKVEDWTSRGTFVVYIYSSAEKIALRRLKRTYGGSAALERFEAAIVDLCKVVKRSVVLPTDGDGLKAVASHINFSWRDPTPGGAQSITWWSEYWNDPIANASLRNRVLTYNEDDVRATFAIRDWLESLGQELRRGSVPHASDHDARVGKTPGANTPSV